MNTDTYFSKLNMEQSQHQLLHEIGAFWTKSMIMNQTENSKMWTGRAAKFMAGVSLALSHDGKVTAGRIGKLLDEMVLDGQSRVILERLATQATGPAKNSIDQHLMMSPDLLSSILAVSKQNMIAVQA